MSEEVHTLKHIVKCLKMEICYGRPINLRNKEIWKTASGESIPIQEMKDSHIFNVLKCLKGNGSTVIPAYYLGKSRQEWLRIFQNESRTRIKIKKIEK